MIANSKWSSPGVVDASVAAKWLIPEQRSIDADRLLESILGSPEGSYVVPEVFFGEIASSLSKRLEDRSDLAVGLQACRACRSSGFLGKRHRIGSLRISCFNGLVRTTRSMSRSRWIGSSRS